ncbi:MAG: chromosome segregation protein SMC [Myxococcaceae bacterium]|nr:chromosome segregation protein SMC [Myxococcaceae bacterium]
MQLLELAAQAVRGCSPSVRLALKPGYLVLKSPGDKPAPLASAIATVLYPDGRGDELQFLAQGYKGGKIGLSIQGNDSNAWRLVRDLGAGGSLHRYDKDSNQFEVAAQDLKQIAQLLRSTVGFPVRATFEQLFTLTPGQLPTQRAKLAAAPVAAPGAKTPPLKKGLSAVEVAAAKTRLQTLEAELAASKEVGDLQFRQDTTTNELYKMEQRLVAVEAVRQKRDEAREALANAPTAKALGLPDDIVERVRNFAATKKARDAAMMKLGDEREQAGVLFDADQVTPLYKERNFWLGLFGGLLLVALGGFMENALRYVALLGLPAFTYSALVALRNIERLQAASRVSSTSDVFRQREKKIVDEFKAEQELVNRAYELTATTTADEFKQAMAKPDELQQRMAELDVTWAEMEVDPDNAGLAEKVAALRTEAEALNGRLQELSGGYNRDAREIARDIERTRELIGLPSPSKEPEPAPEFEGVSAEPETFDDPTPALILLGAELFGTDVAGLWAQLKDRVGQYVGALTDRRYHAVDVEKDGRAFAVAPGRRVPFNELPAKELDLLYVAMRLTLVEKYSAKNKIVFLIEDVFGVVLDGPKLALLGRMLKHLGSLTQVLHITGASHTGASADATLNL